ncbi:hypothetical protein CROQUDRAFT_130891 [Cronartium quercuum f. sp. fusiforme G11]|uniref:Uncharacterized protein n=1 Tax=Cronartium quercuum f. sp. fusiforme G11 TaxID=708437 RepID=A0A9P6NR45_9BASI|nr:hypothetical protein CROQUDRAFT_130891 [Cronartium quercuum f. sp. fusiforme G11]
MQWRCISIGHLISLVYLIYLTLSEVLAVYPSPSRGPSGTLLSPSDGFLTSGPGGTARLPIQYVPVNATNAFTIGIDACLVPIYTRSTPFGSQNVTLIAGGLTAKVEEQGALIQGVFATLSACGEFTLNITEHQLYRNEVIQFQSAAVKVSITCSPVPAAP